MREAERLQVRTLLAAAVAAVVMLLATSARAGLSANIGGASFEAQNAIETDWALSTAGKDNPWNNNNGGSGILPGVCGGVLGPCGQERSTDGNSWNLAAFRFDTLLNLTLSDSQAAALGLDSATAYVHGRFWSDIAPYVDNRLPKIDAMGFNQRYEGNGWAAAVSEHEYEIDAAEAYIDLKKGPLWLRLGKQQIVYGEELGFQTLDQVDSLDLRRHSLFNYSGLEFSDARIGEWTAKLTYTVPDLIGIGLTNSSISAWISPDFQPDVLLPPGSPYNGSTAANFDIQDHGEIARARHKLVYGTVVSGNFYGVDFSGNFYSTPEHVGWLSFAHIPGCLTAFTCFPVDPDRGANIGFGVPMDILLARNYARIFIYGGMASYSIQPIYEFPGAGLINGDIIRVSATYTPNKAFTGVNTFNLASPSLNKPVREGEFNGAIDLEKNTRILTQIPSTYILLEYNFRSRSDLFDDYMPGQSHHNFNLVLLDLVQPLPQARWTLAWVGEAECNSGGAWFMQPAVVYKPTSAQEYQVFYNWASGVRVGTHLTAGGMMPGGTVFGGASAVDEIVFRAIYKF